MRDKDKTDALALEYHKSGRPGKIEVVPTKPFITAHDLSLAYTPGVAAPCLKIAENPDDAYKYTAKGNLVAVISNGSAVLGLGNIGAAAGKPVMEGKGMLFKRFADIDVFDLEINESTVEGMVKIISSLEPTFGGINLEDIKAPECFEIEKQLIEKMNIPVFHDDQHGTAIIASAAFINALEVAKKKINKVKIVFSGAGAAAMACAKLFYSLGVKHENLLMCDSKGVIYKGRTEGMNSYKEEFSVDTKHRSLSDAMNKADAFIGCSARGVLTQDMVKTMAKNPIIFAMANPEPEIFPDEVFEVRSDAIMATGRSDFDNQVNNVLGFPFIFRGALDVRATTINEQMKLAAVHALADLAKEDVPEEVKMAYDNEHFSFGKHYLIPKPFDSRVLTRVTPAVAKAAIDSGVARIEIKDFTEYAAALEGRLGSSAAFMKSMRDRLASLVRKKKRPLRIAFAEGSNTRILNAVKIILEDTKIRPILIGNVENIHSKIDALSLPDEMKRLVILEPKKYKDFEKFYTQYHKKYQRSGVSIYHAEDKMAQETYFGSKLLEDGVVDSLIAGPTLDYGNCMKPIIKIIGTGNGRKVAGIFILVFKNRVLYLADCTAQVEPTSEDLAEIAQSTVELYQNTMNKNPRVAFLSFSNFGSNNHASAKKVRKAVQIAKEKMPDIVLDGEMQADVAINHHISKNLFNFSDLDHSADILIFPELNSANITYKLLQQLSEADAVGPIMIPMNKPVNIIQRTASVSEIVNMSIITAALSEK